VDAGAAFSRAARAPNAQFDDSDYAAINEELRKRMPADKTKFGEADYLWANRIASDIRRSGNVSNPDAAMLTQRALTQPEEPRVMPDGSVQIDPRLPAVKMSEDSLLSLARMRARMEKPTATPQGNEPSFLGRLFGGSAAPGVVNPTTGRADVRGDTAAPAGAPFDHYSGPLSRERISALPLPSQRDVATQALDIYQGGLGSEARRADVENTSRLTERSERQRLLNALGPNARPDMSLRELRREYDLLVREREARGTPYIYRPTPQ
jgi:hypothetical protein